MPAYVRRTVSRFVVEDAAAIVGLLEQAYAIDGFASQYTSQTRAWADVIPELQDTFTRLYAVRPEVRNWTILIEYPLYRLRRRIDVVILADSLVVVVECKVGAQAFTSTDRRQVEEYALDLRDFHAQSSRRRIVPVLWCTGAHPPNANFEYTKILPSEASVGEVVQIGAEGLESFLATIPLSGGEASFVGEEWDRSAYRPVPSVIEAATSIFSGHDVRAITNADADNLQFASARLIELIAQARERGERYLLLLTGVPGSGKTLAGLHVVHSAIGTGLECEGEIVYLSGNTPLVVVLREALARDQAHRQRSAGERCTLGDIRLKVRARIQHINDFLKESLQGSPDKAPHEHVIVFDEAQRAWDEEHGFEKFERAASEPALLLELMSRHHDWCACICLVGGGQEINSGENGVFGWGEALRRMKSDDRRRWSVFVPPDVRHGGPSAGAFALGELPPELKIEIEPNLQLRVPQRSYRSPSVSRWVDCVVAGDVAGPGPQPRS